MFQKNILRVYYFIALAAASLCRAVNSVKKFHYNVTTLNNYPNQVLIMNNSYLFFRMISPRLTLA